MTRFSDAALLKGDFATMLQNPPKDAEWSKTSCDNSAEEAAKSVAQQIFAMREQLDPKTEKLEVITFSSMGPIKVLGIMPIDGDLMRIDGLNPADLSPVSIVQHVEQMSLTFTKAKVKSENPEEQPDDDDGGQIGFVIFDELKTRKKSREAAKRKKPARKPATRKRAAKK
jgi:hypothetical protein